MQKEDRQQSMAHLLTVMARLRDPKDGCPWDREQTFATIAPYTIEEAYEVADAIGAGDRDALQDELGDLLFQVVFYAQMAKERGWFDFDDIAQGIADKMTRRHPHVFAEAEIASVAAQNEAWEAHKAKERAARAAAKGRRAHHKCRVEGCPCRMDFSRVQAALIASSGRATSMSLRGELMG